jgi:uracil phosphoribosyltransferase
LLIQAFQNLLPDADVPVYHLGIFRETSTLVPVEYYNKLPTLEEPHDLVFVIDPIIATGGTALAVIQTLTEWKAKKIVYCCMIASKDGLTKVAKEFPDVDFYVGKIDPSIGADGFIIPG